jgi:hypothetical protein
MRQKTWDSFRLRLVITGSGEGAGESMWLYLYAADNLYNR